MPKTPMSIITGPLSPWNMPFVGISYILHYQTNSHLYPAKTNPSISRYFPLSNRHYTEFTFAISRVNWLHIVIYTNFLVVKSCWIARKNNNSKKKKDDIWAARIVKDCWLLKYPLRVWIMPKEFFIPTIWCRKLNRKPVIFSIKMLDGLCHSVYHILAHFEYTSHSIVPSPIMTQIFEIHVSLS